jgi:drug/metabolite transporter (DMT)-like permease
MESATRPNQLKASWLLLLATFFWGSSFLVMKGLAMVQQQLAPGANTWLIVSLSLVFRFGLAALILIFWNLLRVRKITWLEFYEGAGLGVVGGLGLLFQMDGVNYSSASTGAFLTQCYCVFIPLLIACRKREWPSRTIVISTAMVLVGVAVLSQFDFKKMHLGRGELETLLASLFFTAQILWLERPRFSGNNPHNFSVVMFAVLALIFLPVAFSGGNAMHILPAYNSWLAIVLSLWLTIFCTLIAYGLMNYWQPFVPATQAGLIYCAEPVFTSIFALFLPQWLSAWGGIAYANETVTTNQIFGGGLITAANILILVQAARITKKQKEIV